MTQLALERLRERVKIGDSNSFAKGESLEVAFVFIRTKPGKEREVLEKVRKIGVVTESFLLYGDYDLVAKVETEVKERLQAVVMGQIRAIKGIEDTSTNFVFNSDVPYL